MRSSLGAMWRYGNRRGVEAERRGGYVNLLDLDQYTSSCLQTNKNLKSYPPYGSSLASGGVMFSASFCYVKNILFQDKEVHNIHLISISSGEKYEVATTTGRRASDIGCICWRSKTSGRWETGQVNLWLALTFSLFPLWFALTSPYWFNYMKVKGLNFNQSEPKTCDPFNFASI